MNGNSVMVCYGECGKSVNILDKSMAVCEINL